MARLRIRYVGVSKRIPWLVSARFWMQAVQFRVFTPYVEKKSRTHALSNAEEHEMERVQFKRQGETQTAAVRKPSQSETTQTHPGKRKHETPNRTLNSGTFRTFCRDLQKTFLVRALATLLIGVCTY